MKKYLIPYAELVRYETSDIMNISGNIPTSDLTDPFDYAPEGWMPGSQE